MTLFRCLGTHPCGVLVGHRPHLFPVPSCLSFLGGPYILLQNVLCEIVVVAGCRLLASYLVCRRHAPFLCFMLLAVDCFRKFCLSAPCLAFCSSLGYPHLGQQNETLTA